MASSYTSLLGLVLPVTGELSGNWGDVWNDSGTSLIDAAISGTTSLTTDADVTLTTTDGVANQARQAIILWNPASGTVTRNITAPAQSKIYTVINASGGTQSIVFRGAGPTTGVTIIKGESAVVAWNGTDFIKVSNTGGGGSFTNVTISGTTTLSGLTASTALALDASKNVVSVTNTGTGNNVLATSPTLVTPTLGTPASATLTNATGLPISTGVSGLGTGVATSLAVNVGTTGAPVVNGGVLGTPSSGTVTNLTGTASININGTVGATTASTGAFTTLAASGAVTLSGGTANGVAYLNGSKVLISGSALTFDGTYLNANGLRISGSDGSNTIYKASGDFGLTANAGALTYQTTTNRPQVFYVNSAEQMRLNDTGLGIGTSSPNYRLQIRSSGTSTSYAGNIVARLESNGAGYSSTLQFSNNVDASATLGLVGTSLGFGVGTTQMLTLDSSGNLGLGVTPSASSACTNIELPYGATLSARSNTAAPQFAMMSNAVGNWYEATYKINGYATQYTQQGFEGTHKWYTAPSGTAGNAISFSQSMTLDASGNLGIGTSSPIQRLHVGGNGNIYASGGATWYTGGDLYLRAGPSGSLRFGANDANDLMRLDSAGNLGLGVTPSAWLSTYKALQIGSVGRSLAQTGSGAGDWTMAFNAIYSAANSRWDYAYTGDAAVRYSQIGSGAHAWYTAPSGTAGNAISFTQAMTLTAGGSLGVGVTDPGARLEIGSSGTVLAKISSSTNTAFRGVQFGLNADSNVYGSVAMEINGGEFRTSAGFSGWGGLQTFYTNGSERARIDSNGNLIQTVNTTAATLANNNTLTFSIVDNSTLRISVRGSDGTTRTATVALT